jgi:RHS repeat-associated protein
LADGRWIERIVSTNSGTAYFPAFTNRYVWDNQVLLAVLDHTNGLVLSFMRGLDLSGSIQGAGGVGGVLAVKAGTSAQCGTMTNTTHFTCYDGNGNVTALVNAADGSESARYEYGAFAERLRETGPMAKLNPIRFSTQYTDDVIGDVKYLFRDLREGRWLSRDPIEEQGGANLYGFVQNAALNFFDALGLEIQEIVFWTYIEWPTVTDPFKNVFRGDNHAGGAGSFRTIHRILIETCGPKKGLIPGSEWKDTGITELLDPKTGAVLKTGKATGKTLKATVTTGPDTVTVKMEGNETNPLHKHFGISAPAISYHLTIIFNTKTGRATFSGTHDGFPSYQAYSGGKLIRDWSHVQAGTDPWDLRPPEEISFSGGFKIEKCCP